MGLDGRGPFLSHAGGRVGTRGVRVTRPGGAARPEKDLSSGGRGQVTENSRLMGRTGP
ncbi:hypothetical protein SGPA1_40180 [Streptomyces misionensis JCM 4497]